jgi:hypothetical protein
MLDFGIEAPAERIGAFVQDSDGKHHADNDGDRGNAAGSVEKLFPRHGTQLPIG